MKDTICSVLFLAATVFGVIHARPDGKAVARTEAHERQESPTAAKESDPASVSPSSSGEFAEDQIQQQNLQVASEVGELKKADLLIGRRLQTAIDETKSQFQEEANARSQLASDIQLLVYEKEQVSRQLAELRAQLQTKADRSELVKLDTGLNETRDEHKRLIESLESQLAAMTNQLQQAAKPVEQTVQKPHVDETSDSLDTLLYSFKSTAGEAIVFERSSGSIEVELNGTRHPVMVKPTKERCGHFRSLQRNLGTRTLGTAEFGYLDHFETIDGRRVHVKGYVVFVQE